MRAVGYMIVIMLFLVSGCLKAQNAPISMITDAEACPGAEITVPIRVTGFNSIGSLSLKIQFNATALTYQSWTNTSGFPGLMLNNATGGTLIAGGYTTSASGFSIPDDSIFFSITFIYNGGPGTISWNDNGPSCEFTGPFPNFIVLNDTPASKYYINGLVSPALTANFIASNPLPGIDDTISFTDLSSGAPNDWIWNFSPGSFMFVNGTNQNSQNPQVKFLTNGAFSASLKVSNNSCSIMLVRDAYLHVGTPGLWTGQLSTDWNNSSNWHNEMIPDSTISVTIPSISLNWPEYPGNFSIGVQCLSLIIESSGQLTVFGDLSIP